MATATPFREGTIEIAQAKGFKRRVLEDTDRVDQFVKGKTIIEACYSAGDYVSSALMSVDGQYAGGISPSDSKKMATLRSWFGVEGDDLTRRVNAGVQLGEAGIGKALKIDGVPAHPAARNPAKPSTSKKDRVPKLDKAAESALAAVGKSAADLIEKGKAKTDDPFDTVTTDDETGDTATESSGQTVKLSKRMRSYLRDLGIMTDEYILGTGAKDGSAKFDLPDDVLDEIENVVSGLAETDPKGTDADTRADIAAARALARQLGIL